MRNKLLVLLVIAVCLAALPAQAQQAGAFARLGFGARGMALGNALVADASGAASPYYNPALAPYVDQTHVSTTYTFLSLDRELQYLQFATPLEPRAGLAVGLIHAGVNDIDGRDASGYHTRTYSTDQYALMVAFGIRMGRFSGGLGIRLYRASFIEAVDPVSGMGLSAGLTLGVTDDLRLGLAVDDLLARYKWNTANAYGSEGRQTTDYFPMRVRLGAAYELLDGALHLMAEYELRMIRAQERSRTVDLVGRQPQMITTARWLHGYQHYLRLGGEWYFTKMFAARVGIGHLRPQHLHAAAPSAGFTIHHKVAGVNGRLNYAAVLQPFTTGVMHVLELQVDL